MCVVHHCASFFSSLPAHQKQHHTCGQTAGVQRAVNQPAGFHSCFPPNRAELHTLLERKGVIEECFLSQHTHTNARVPRRRGQRSCGAGCQNATLINVDVSLEDVSLFLEEELKRDKARWGDASLSVALRAVRINERVIKGTCARRWLKTDRLFLTAFIPPVYVD